MTAAARPDLCVIGASEAGRAVAMGAAAMGCSVVVVDDGDPSGRRNRDLTVELLRLAARAPASERSWAALGEGVRRGAAERSHARLRAMNIRVIAATGRFADADTVLADGTAVRARRFVIATGRAETPPSALAGEGGSRGTRETDEGSASPLQGLPDPSSGAARHLLPQGEKGIAPREREPVTLTIADLPRLAAMPPRLLVAGGGADAVAVAQSLARLGVDVTLRADPLLPGADREFAALLLTRLRRDGVRLIGADQPEFGGPALTEILAPALDHLALDLAGIRLQGAALALTPALRTTNRRVFAVGCPGGAASTAAGLAQVGVVLRAALLRLPARDDPGRVPLLVVTDPEIAQVGTTEETAGSGVQVWRWSLAQTARGIAAGDASGHVKVITDRRGRVLGAGIVGPEAREAIGFWSLAVARRLTLGDLAALPMPLPSWSEAVRGIATAHAARRLGNAWVRRAVGLIRRFD